MGDDVKITVIATGFRDQMMPERRARMLSVEEAPVVSVPLVAVPVEAPNTWLNETRTAPPIAEPEPPRPPSPPRFKSEDEFSDEEQAKASFVFTSTAPAVATSVTFAAPASSAMEEPDRNYERAQADREETLSIRMEEPIIEAAIAPQAHDFVAEFAEPPTIEAIQESHLSEPVASLFNEANEQENRDLDVPAFMRRHKF
jgi:cell division protein FtsZ